MPVVFPCLFKFCKVCALNQEAEAQQQQKGGKQKKKGKKGKGKKVKANQPTPCLVCGALCDTPVAELPLDVALLNVLEAATALVIPPCDVCDEE